MKKRIDLPLWILVLIPIFSSAQFQLPQAYLKDELPSEFMYPLTVTTSDGIVSGYGNINPLDYGQLLFTSKKPTTNKVKDWIIVKGVEEAQLVIKDTLTLIPLYGKKGKSKKNGILNVFLYENEKVKLYKSLNPYLVEVYFVQPKDIPDAKYQNKMLVLRNESTLKRFGKKAFKKCEKLVENIDSNKYTNTYGSLIQLLNDYDELCSGSEW